MRWAFNTVRLINKPLRKCSAGLRAEHTGKRVVCLSLTILEAAS